MIGTGPALSASPIMGRVLLLGLVSSAEFYFRSILAGLIRICPRCREHSAKTMLSLGAVYYHGINGLGFGVLEATSFSTAGEIRNHTQKFTSFTIPSSGSLAAALQDFDRVCQFRHASVHARGELGAQNIRELGLTLKGRHSAHLELAQWHGAVEVTGNLVRAYNRFLYREVVGSWNDKALLTGDWRRDRKRFQQIFDMFYCARDGLRPRSAYHTYLAIRSAIRKRLAGAPVRA